MPYHVVNFSGGKDSTAMLLKMIENGMRIDKVVFIDTTKEFPEMYEHIEKVKNYIHPIKIETVTIDFDYWFGEHVKTKGKNKGSVGYGWPDNSTRWCTFLKRDKKLQYYRSCGITTNNAVEFVGISHEESNRTILSSGDGYTKHYPLVDWKMTGEQAIQYCYNKGFDWKGLYKKFSRASCWCCPLSNMSELRMLYEYYPELWKELEKMDKKSHRRFRVKHSVAGLTKKFERERKRGFFVKNKEGKLTPNK